MNEPTKCASVSVEPECLFAVHSHVDGAMHVVEMLGELDLASRAAAIDACLPVDQLDVLVDLSDLVFMDCAGYGALVASTQSLERRGGSLVLMNAIGEPLRLLTLIEQLEPGLCAPLRDGTVESSRAGTVSLSEHQLAAP